MPEPFATAALDYAREGLRVFVIKPGQKAGGSRWVHGPASEVATADLDEIARRAAMSPQANIGIATGDGLGVLDLDFHHGAVRPEWAIPTREAQTPHGGLHCYYRVDGQVRNSVGELGTGLDVRGDGGMCVAPPSRTEDGAYTWITDPATPLASVPVARFHEYTRDAAGHPGQSRGRSRKRPEEVREGERHDQALAWAAWFASQGCDADEVEDLTWQLVERFADPVEPGDPNIERLLAWINRKQAAADAVDQFITNKPIAPAV